MLEKIFNIKNIGRFYDVSIQDPADRNDVFKNFNLIYADNGTGKSTISTILKSLWKDDPQRLINKRTIGTTGEISAELQISGTIYKFENGQWDQEPRIALEIFDEEFVEKNVFSLSEVGQENRRGLFKYIVLGDNNVAKVKKIETLDSRLKGELKDAIETAERELIRSAKVTNIEILDETNKLDDEILKAMQNRVIHNDKIINDSERIKREAKLDRIPDFDGIPYRESISADLGSLSLAAEYQAHVKTHNSWIKGGMGIVPNGDENSCPFCFQNIEGNAPIAAYKTFFSDEYEELRDKVDAQISAVERIYSEAAVKNVVGLMGRNNERCGFWHSLDKEIPESDATDVPLKETLKAFKDALKNVLEKKKNNLLDAIAPNEIEAAGLGQEVQFRQAIADYNTGIDKINTKIQTIKDESQDIAELRIRTDRARIRVACNNVKYHNQKTVELYETLVQHRQERKNANDTIKNLRGEINQESLIILEKYQNSINRELKNFSVDFSIQEVKRKSDSARKENVHFNICLKGQSFDPNGSAGSPYKLSNTLSSGDKSTLAFAFFIAKFRDADLRNQILVFDDPITSLDFFRKTHTKRVIEQFKQLAAQIIVLTHSAQFAKLFKPTNVRTNRFVRIMKNNLPSGLSCTSYNKFSDMSIDKYNHDHNLIKQYIAEPNQDKIPYVMKSIRSYVESTIMQYRLDFSDLTLGGMIGILNEENNICNDYMDNLEIINGNIIPESSHGSSDNTADYCENITDDALMDTCLRAISISAPPLRR